MTLDAPHFLALVWRSVTDPVPVAQGIRDMRWDRNVLWTGFALVAVLSAILQGVLQLMIPAEAEQNWMPPALIYGALMYGFLALNAWLTYVIGKAMGGTGSFDETLTLMVWFQLISLTLSGAQFLLMLVMPLLAVVFALASFMMLLRCMVHFIDVLHRFDSLPKAFGTAFMALIGAVAAGLPFYSLLGLNLPGGPI